MQIQVQVDTTLGARDEPVRQLVKGRMCGAVREAVREMFDELKARGGGDAAVADDKVRRAEEQAKAEEARRTKAAEKARMEAEVASREAKRKEEEAARAASMPQKMGPERVAATGSEWNAGSYHWEEKPVGAYVCAALHHLTATPSHLDPDGVCSWAAERLKELFGAWECEVPSGTLSISEVKSVTGDASVRYVRAGWAAQLRATGRLTRRLPCCAA